jgi:peptidyl-prolyl cis-trans isomerase D
LPGIGPAPQFTEAVFAMKASDAPVAIALPRGMVVAQVAAIKPPATPTFDQVKDQLATGLMQEKAMKLLADKSKELAEKAQATHSLAAAAKAVGATVKSSDLIAPDGQVPDLGQVAQVAPQLFSMKVGEISQPIQLGQKSALAMLTQRQEPSDAELASIKDRLRQSLLEHKRSEAEQAALVSYHDRLEKAGKITIDKAKLETLAGNAAP